MTLRLPRALKYLALASGVALLGAAACVAWLGLSFYVDGHVKAELQRVASPDGVHEFALLGDRAGFGDPAWYVYELDRGQRLPPPIREAHNTDGVLFWNYSEDGRYTAAAHLDIRHGRYLVFSRGGRLHSLYDIRDRRVLVNEESPWAYYSELATSEQDRWVLMHLEAPIRRILSRCLEDSAR